MAARLGWAVAAGNGIAAVGAPSDDDLGENAGSVSVFTRSGASCSFAQELSAFDGQSDHSFGRSLALDADTLVVGAPSFSGIGAVYVFVQSGGSFSLHQKLTAPDGAPEDGFGFAVSVDGDQLVVLSLR